MFKKFLVLALLLSIVATSVCKTLEVIVTDTKLPSERVRISTGYDGDDTIYLWGGRLITGAWLRDILKYSISNQTIEYIGIMPNTQDGSGCWIGNNKFVHIGGYFNPTGQFLKDVWNFDTANPSKWTTVANLTDGLADSSSIWDEGVNTYTIGGRFSHGSTSNEILQYSSATRIVVNVGVLPNAVTEPALVWDSTTDSVYIFGGHQGNGGYNDILKFDAVNGQVTTLNVTLPTKLSSASAVWNGKEAFIIGGTTGGGVAPSPIVRFNPTTNKVTSVPVNNLSPPLLQTACVFVKQLNRIYIFGGWTGGRYRDEIMYIDMKDIDTPDTSLPAYTWYIVIGGAVAVVIIIAMIIFCCYRKYSHRKNLQKNIVVVDQSVPLPMSPLQSYYENQNHLGVNLNSQLRGPFNANQNFGRPATATISRAEGSTVGVRDIEEPPPPYTSVIKM